MPLFFHLAVVAWAALMVHTAQAQQSERSSSPPGAVIYSRNCAICHGVDMKGQDAGWSSNMPYVPPLDASGKVWRLSDVQFYLALQEGSHLMNMRLSNIEMPPFVARLSSADIASLFDYVKASWSKQQIDYQAEVTRQQEGPRPNMMTAGRDLYMRRCAICHGAEMEGQTQNIGEGNRARSVVIPALKDNGLAQGMSDQDLRQLIMGGETYHPAPHSEYRMPNAKLSDEDVRALIGYLRRAWAAAPPH